MTELLEAWRAARVQWAAANAEGRSVRYCNRIMDRIWGLSEQIAARSDLRPQIEDLCEQREEADDRLWAALVRERWDRDGAAATLQSLIEESGATVVRPLTMTTALSVKTTPTASTAALCLLNIDEGRGNVGGAGNRSDGARGRS